MLTSAELKDLAKTLGRSKTVFVDDIHALIGDGPVIICDICQQGTEKVLLACDNGREVSRFCINCFDEHDLVLCALSQ